MGRRWVFLSLILCLGVHAGYSQRWWRRLVPDFIPAQFAGNFGLVSAGIGYSFFNDRYQAGLMYGYSPASLTYTPVHTVAVKNTFRLYRFAPGTGSEIQPYAGVGLLAEAGGISFVKLPDTFSRGYYFPKALHVTGFAGARWRKELKRPIAFSRAIELYGEVGSYDVLIWYKVISKEVTLGDILSVAAGINLIIAAGKD